MLAAGDLERWSLAPYRPTPGILESAREIFAGNTVADIKHSYADNLDVTVAAIQNSILRAKQGNLRLLCLVTGVPGSGKTLTGLSAIEVEKLDYVYSALVRSLKPLSLSNVAILSSC